MEGWDGMSPHMECFHIFLPKKKNSSPDVGNVFKRFEILQDSSDICRVLKSSNSNCVFQLLFELRCPGLDRFRILVGFSGLLRDFSADSLNGFGISGDRFQFHWLILESWFGLALK